jgi:hypothetical protein
MYKYLSISGVLLLLAVAYFYTQVDWDARAVRKSLNELIELVEKDGPVSKFEALGRSHKLPSYFAENARVEYFPSRRLPADSAAMRGAFLSVWGDIETASVRVLRHDVQIDDGKMTAESQVLMRSSVMMNGADKMGDTLEYRIYWIKIEGDWRIREVIALG